MSQVVRLAHKILGEVVANSLNTEECPTPEDFLRNYERVKDANKYTVGEKNIGLLRCALLSQCRPLLKHGHHLSQLSLQRTVILHTGSSQVDKALSGGMYTSEVTSVCGPAGYGKTQLALQTAALACLKHNCNVIYVDTSNCFSAERMQEMLSSHGVTEQKMDNMLKRITVFNIFDVSELEVMLHCFISIRKEKSVHPYSNVRLLIVDAITPLLCSVLGYKSQDSYVFVDSISTLLRRVAVEFHVAVLVINGTVYGQTSKGYTKPALGIQWHQTADKMVMITGYDARSSPGVYSCQLVASRKRGLML